MRQLISRIFAIGAAFLLVLATPACRPTQKVETQASARVQGELITPAVSSPTAATPVAIKPVSPAVSTVVPEPKPVATGSDYTTVGFDRLASYNFEVDDTPWTNQDATLDKANDQIPTTVKAFNDRKVSIRGFMLPLKVDDGVVTEFLIMKDQSTCCYGNVPKINEWVNVKTLGKGVKPIMDVPISILGTLHVGATRENGYLVGIYQMDGDKLVIANN